MIGAYVYGLGSSEACTDVPTGEGHVVTEPGRGSTLGLSGSAASNQIGPASSAMIHARQGWRLKLRRGATGKRDKTLWKITAFNMLRPSSSFFI